MQNDRSRAGAVGAPDFPAEQWNLLDPGIKTLWVLSNLIGLVIVVVVGVGLDVVFRAQAVAEAFGFRLFPGLFALLFILVFGALPFILIGLKYRNTLYLVSEEEVCVRSGIWWKSERYVPRARIQYVDVSSGPVERHLGLATLAVYVGGQAGAGAHIAGLKGETAEALRRELVAELPERRSAEVEPPPLAGGPSSIELETPRRSQPLGGVEQPADEPSGSNPWAEDETGSAGPAGSNPYAEDDPTVGESNKRD